MSSPDKEQTELKNPPKQTRMVKIKTNYPIRLVRGKDEIIKSVGDVVEVTEEEAIEFCDRKFDLGIKDAFGHSDPAVVKNKVITRAVRVG